MILICQYTDHIVSTGQYSKLTLVRYLHSIQCQSLVHKDVTTNIAIISCNVFACTLVVRRLEPDLGWMWMFWTKASIFSGVTYPVTCSFLRGATFAKSGMAAILNFKFTQKRIIKNILAFRSRRITIFMSKPLIFLVSDCKCAT